MGKLNVYRNADAEELSGLHPSDRLMVKLIQINRLAPRIEGMLYKCAFEESWSLLDDVSHPQRLIATCLRTVLGCQQVIRGWAISFAGEALQRTSFRGYFRLYLISFLLNNPIVVDTTDR